MTKSYTFCRTEKNFYYYDENGYGFMADVFNDGVVVKYALSRQIFQIVREREKF